MINNANQFDNLSKEKFKHSDFTTLANSASNRIRFNLESTNEDQERVNIAYSRVIDIFKTIFLERQIWLRIALWDSNIDLKNIGISNDLIRFSYEDEPNVLYVYFDDYAEEKVSTILLSIISYEVGLEAGQNVQCFFYNFDIPVVINVYDDRGMDIVTENTEVINILETKYSKFIID